MLWWPFGRSCLPSPSCCASQSSQSQSLRSKTSLGWHSWDTQRQSMSLQSRGHPLPSESTKPFLTAEHTMSLRITSTQCMPTRTTVPPSGFVSVWSTNQASPTLSVPATPSTKVQTPTAMDLAVAAYLQTKWIVGQDSTFQIARILGIWSPSICILMFR